MACAVSWVAVTAAATGPPEVARELPATVNFQHGHQAHNSPALAADPTDERFVALASRLDHDTTEFGCALQLSGDAGRTWVPADPVPQLPEGAKACYAPEVAFDADGTLYFLFLGLHTQANIPMGAFLTTSTDRGRTFSPPQRILGPRAFQVRMAIDDAGRMHVVWLQLDQEPGLGSLPPPPNPIMAMHSDDGGRSFSEPVQVNAPDRERVVAPALALGADRSVHVLYYDLGEDARDYHSLEGPTWQGTWTLALATSTDAGRSFSSHVVVDDQVAPPGRVQLIFTMPPATLATDAGDTLFAAWTDARHGDPDVLLRRSWDAGRTWDEPVRVNDDPVGNGRTQELPRLAVSSTGRVDAVFYDRRGDPDDLLTDVSYTFSTDGGQTLARNVRVTSARSDTRVGRVYALPAVEGQADFGSRLGLWSQADRVVLAWADTRNAVHPRHQEVFTTEVSVPGPGPLQWLVPLGAALLAAALLRPHRRWRARSRGTTSPAATTTLAFGLLAAGCTPSAGPQLPPSPAMVTVRMSEYQFDWDGDIPAGRVLFTARNDGSEGHDLVLIRLPEDLPGTLDEQLRSDTRRPADTIRLLPGFEPGDQTVFAADLTSGRYGLVCFRPTSDGSTHALKGMNAEIVVP